MKNLLCIYFSLVISSLTSAQVTIEEKQELIVPNPVSEIYFGKEVIDDYRNLENTRDSLVKNWYSQQNKFADNLLSSISGLDSLIVRMEEINNRESYYIEDIEILENGNYFYLKKEKEEKKYRLYYRENYNSNEILLYDPNNFQMKSGNDYTINYIKPSWEGHFVVVSLSYSGRELSDMIVVDVKNKIVLPEVIDKAWPSSFLGVSWLPDSSGFIFLQFPITDIDNKEFKKNTQSVLYKLGDETDKFKILLNSKLYPELNIQANDYPIVTIKSREDPYAVAYIASVKNFWDAHFVPIDELQGAERSWKSFYTKDDMVYTNTGVFSNGEYFYISALNASNFNISYVPLNNSSFKDSKILIAEKKHEVVDEFIINMNGLFYSTITNGVKGNLYHFNENFSHQIQLPKSTGEIGLSTQGNHSDALWVTLTGWTSADSRYLYSKNKNEFKSEELAPIAKYPEFENFIVEELEIPSHDGVLVPLSIIYNSGLKKNGSNPTLFYGYGAYGDAMNPFFSPIFLTWVQEGGILCISHVRGGGEKGDAWHKAGYKDTKMNTWKDFIATAQFMIENKFTSNKNTIAYSSSAGGIMVGRAITERPELFAASIVDVGVLNPLRRESFSGSTNFKEYGTVKDSIEFNGLLAMDPYMHLKRGEEYPAGLYITGMNDPRIAPWMTGKFVAKIQAYSSSDKPILYKVEDDAGHATSASSDDVYRKWAEMFAFAFWQTGHPRFYVK